MVSLRGVSVKESCGVPRAAVECPQLPPLLVVVTGNGPRRQFYEEQMAALQLRAVHFRTGYLKQFRDYAILLGTPPLSAGFPAVCGVQSTFSCLVVVIAPLARPPPPTASAHVGVSLHISSSGIDLPMKVCPCSA